MAKKGKVKPGLGKGLGALLPSIEFSDKGFKFKSEESEEEFAGSIALIDISKITYNPYQPRKDFDEKTLEDLKNSIIEHGVIQPITVGRSHQGFDLIAGERRLRASQAAGIKKIPAYIMDIVSDIQKLEIALIENVQREDLNTIEVANGYQRLIEECECTQEQVAAKVGKDRTTVTNFIRLLRLPEKIQESLRKKEISMGHARALLGLSEKNAMIIVWTEIVKKNLSVRVVENLVKDIENGRIDLSGKKKLKQKTASGDKPHISPEDAVVLEDSEKRLRHVFATQVRIKTKSMESGLFEFEFYSKDDFERLIDLFMDIEKYNNV